MKFEKAYKLASINFEFLRIWTKIWESLLQIMDHYKARRTDPIGSYKSRRIAKRSPLFLPLSGWPPYRGTLLQGIDQLDIRASKRGNTVGVFCRVQTEGKFRTFSLERRIYDGSTRRFRRSQQVVKSRRRGWSSTPDWWSQTVARRKPSLLLTRDMTRRLFN